MLKRRNFYLLFCILLLVGSVVAEPPYSDDLYESMVRAQSASTANVVHTAAAPSPGKWRPVAVQSTDADEPPAPKAIKTAEPIQHAKPASAAAPRYLAPASSATLLPSASSCQTCSPPQCWDRGKCLGRTYFSTSEPFGFCVNGAMKGQVMNGLTAQAVFYQYDFNNTPVPGAPNSIDRAGLNFCGKQQLLRVAELVNHMPVPRVVVETSRNHQIDEARRQSVIAGLSEVMGTAIPAEWVVIDQPPSNPLNGEEAQIIRENLLLQTESRGLYDANDRSSGNGDSGGDSSDINR